MAKTYILKENSIHERFMNSRAKIQFFGGGFGNGKTSAVVIKSLNLLKDYPGMNSLMARETYPKLNDTLRKTFIEFCPENWIESFPTSKNSDNTCKLINGSQVNFRYTSQRKSTEDGSSTSNLLSANYDLAVIDQIEDPGITYKDFTDILGRLRGTAVYRGEDESMPRTGPRWFFVTANPTRNWVYTTLVKPIHQFHEHGIIGDDLLCLRDRDNKPILDEDGKPKLLMDIIEGSTYENEHVLEADFIQGLESVYRGQMRDRFLKGEWAAYEGLVYPEFNQVTHVLPHHTIMSYLNGLSSYKLSWLYGYDFGMASPACYLLAAVDHKGNIFVLDGFYKAEARIDWQASEMTKLRWKYKADEEFIYADPDIFRRKNATNNGLVGKSVAELFFDVDASLKLTRGNNDIDNGIIKIKSYLNPYSFHMHPITGNANAPYLYVSDNCPYLVEEFNGYFWQTNKRGDRVDKPTDGKDHALDTLKYMLSHAPDIATLREKDRIMGMQPAIFDWQEIESKSNPNGYRY